MAYDVLIVGAGMSGLTAAAYLSEAGKKVLVVERMDYSGGLVNSFNYKGFQLDGGIRSIESSGIVFPMLRQLDIKVDFIRSIVSMGIEDKIIRIDTEEGIDAYGELLISKFPQEEANIRNIIVDIKKITRYMDILYGIDNPLFLDLKKDRSYFIKTIIPWMFKYAFTIGKVQKLNTPVDEYLTKFTNNQALIDLIAQHFFQKTPAFFALSYFSLYLDYNYPRGGTAVLPKALESFIRDHGGEFQYETTITSVDPERRVAFDDKGNHYHYNQLVWAADNRYLYRNLDLSNVKNQSVKQAIETQRELVADKRGGDSILTVYLTVDKDPDFFRNIASEHVFYTPKTTGLYDAMSRLPNIVSSTDKKEVFAWLKQYFEDNTFEVSIPVLRDESLAPKGKTGLIISTLFDYDLAKHVRDMGWYEEFKTFTEEIITDIFDKSLYPGIADKVIDRFSASPLTLERYTNNTDGAITGWAFTNKIIPAESRLIKIARSVQTPIPNVFQAGQWTYSPAGLPVAILTGKLAADKVRKQKQ